MSTETKTQEELIASLPEMDFRALDALFATCPVAEPDGITVILTQGKRMVGGRRANVWAPTASKPGKTPAMEMKVGGWVGEPCVVTPGHRVITVKANAFVKKTVAVGMAAHGRAVKGPDDFGDE